MLSSFFVSLSSSDSSFLSLPSLSSLSLLSSSYFYFLLVALLSFFSLSFSSLLLSSSLSLSSLSLSSSSSSSDSSSLEDFSSYFDFFISVGVLAPSLGLSIASSFSLLLSSFCIKTHYNKYSLLFQVEVNPLSLFLLVSFC